MASTCQQVAGAGGDAVKRMAEVATALLQKDGIRGTTGGQKRRAEADLRTCRCEYVGPCLTTRKLVQ